MLKIDKKIKKLGVKGSMNLSKLRRVDFKRLLPALLLMFLLSASYQITWGTSDPASINDILVQTPGDGTAKITFSLSGKADLNDPVFYDNPTRLVYDFDNTILVYNEGRTRKFPVEVGDFNSFAISQFQRNPNVVRLVLNFKSGSKKELLRNIKLKTEKGIVVLSYIPEGVVESPKAEPIQNKSIKVSKLLHQRVGPDIDRFTFKASTDFSNPQVKNVTGGIVLNFKNAIFDVPVKDGQEYQVPVGGNFVDEIQILNQAEGAVLFLRIKESARTFTLDSKFERMASSELRFDLMRSYAAKKEEVKTPKPVTTSQGKVAGLVQVLGSGMETTETSLGDVSAKIIRIQYQPLSVGERFIIEAVGDFKPDIQKLKYPNRLSLTSSNTSVVLPKGAEDRFQVKIEGALSKLMKVFVKDVEGKPESVIQFYYEIPESEDIQYKFYSTDTRNLFNLDLMPVAESVPQEAVSEKAPVSVPKVEAPKQEVKETPVVKEKAKTEVEEKAKEESKPAEVSKKPDLVTFEIPQVEEREPTVQIPSSAPEPEKEKVETKTEEEPKQAPAPEPKREEVKETVKPVDIPKAPVKETKPVEIPKEPARDIKPVEKPKAPAPEKQKLAPIVVQHEKSDKTDRFVISSRDPIENYSRAEMNYPTRLAIEFPGREVKFGELKAGVSHYIRGNAAESVRIIEQDYPEPRTIFFINLNQSWDNTECALSGSPNQIIVDVTRVVSEEAPQVKPVVPEKPATIETKPPVTEPEPKAVPKAPVEVKTPVISEPEEVAPVADEDVKKIDQLNFIIEKPKAEEESRDFSFDVSKETKTEEVTEEPVLETKPVEPETPKPVEIPVETKAEEKPVIQVPKAEVKPEAPKTEEIVQPVKPVELPKEMDEEEVIEIKVIDGEKEKLESGDIVAMFHPPDTMPLKKGEIVKPANCVGSVEWNPDIGLGQLTIESTGAYLPNPNVHWFNYPCRLVFNFEDVGLDMAGAAQPDRWEKNVSGESVNKIQVIQESGGRVPLSATAILYMQPGYDKLNVQPKIQKLDDNSVRIDLVEIGAKPVAEVKPVEPSIPKVEETIEITDEDFELRDIEEKPVIEKPVEIPKVAPKEPEKPFEIKVGESSVKFEPQADDKSKEPLVTVTLQNAEIEDVLFIIAENTDIDISMDKAVRGTISLRVTRKPVSDVFNLIASQGNFKWNKYNDIYLFGSEQYIWSLPGVIKSEVVRLKYAEPLKVRQILTQMRLAGPNSVTLYQAPSVSGTGGRLNVATAQDAIILKGDERQIKDMLDVIKKIDVPPLLIKVNMKVIEFSLIDNKNIGFSWSSASGGGEKQKGFVSFSFTEKNFLPGDLTFQGFRREGQFDYNVIFNYLVEKGNAKILADTSLVVTNGSRGEFFVGENIPYRSTFQVSDFGRVTQRIQKEDIGMNMRFKAQAADDDTITLYIDPDLRNLREITDIGPRTSKKNLTTTIRIPSGQPYAIGGLINESDRVTYDKIPFLGDLPLLGKLFRGKNKQLNRSEIVVIFIPEIIKDAAVLKYEEEMAAMDEAKSGDTGFSLAD